MPLIGKCGDNCEYCPRYIATLKGTIEALEEVKALWVRIGLRENDFPVEQMACQGCRPENKCAFPELRNCVTRKQFETCAPCEAYPCRLVRGVLANSESLRQRALKVCSKAEMTMLGKAFFLPKSTIGPIINEGRR